MRTSSRLFLLLAAVAVIAVPSYARERSHSYITYDDGGTTIRQSEDGREVDTRVNMPVFPGDEVTTGRRGRVEIRMADGNVIALDRSTSVRFRSILDSYDGDSDQTIVELKYGHVAVEREDDTREMLRLDTPNASYAATEQAIYAVEADARGNDRVTVLDGVMEVRTPSRTTRVRHGEEARIDDGGIYDLVNARNTADEFERWFIARAGRYDHFTGRYLDRSIAYSESDLEPHGSWMFAASFGGWCWRPHVAVGWRPYYNGYWRHSPGGVLVWVSNEPWGWAPYHYGRWAYEPAYGWVWLPGAAYAPAWVYWMYGPSYVGWAPMGWYDCYRPYYDWAYRPYARVGLDGGGFYGRVRPGEIDLRPWTFVTPNSLINRRADQASLTTDVIRERLRRDGNTGLVTSNPARFSRNDFKDPSAAVGNIYRRGIGSGTGRETSGSAADMTPFFRRDPELSKSVRERVVRLQPSEGGSRVGGAVTGRVGAPSGIPTPGTTGTLEGRVNRGSDGTAARSDIPVNSITRDGRTVNRGERGDDPAGAAAGLRRHDGGSLAVPATPSTVTVSPTTSGNNDWRRGRAAGGSGLRRGDSGSSATPSESPSASERRSIDRGSQEREPINRSSEPATRDRGVRDRGTVDRGTTDRADRGTVDRGTWDRNRRGDSNVRGGESSSNGESSTRERDVPRRIIDGIGGARIWRGGDSSSSGSSHDGGSRDSGSSRSSAPRDSGRSSERSSPPPSHNDGGSHRDSGSSRSHDGGGKVKRD